MDSSTPSGKLVLQIFSALAEYDRERILERTKAGQVLARVKGKHMRRPERVNQENLAKVKKALERGMSVCEIVALTDISLSSVKRCRKLIQQ